MSYCCSYVVYGNAESESRTVDVPMAHLVQTTQPITLALGGAPPVDVSCQLRRENGIAEYQDAMVAPELRQSRQSKNFPDPDL